MAGSATPRAAALDPAAALQEEVGAAAIVEAALGVRRAASRFSTPTPPAPISIKSPSRARRRPTIVLCRYPAYPLPRHRTHRHARRRRRRAMINPAHRDEKLPPAKTSKEKAEPKKEEPSADPKTPDKLPGEEAPGNGDPDVKNQQPKQLSSNRKIIYTGDLEFEVQSFDNSLDTIKRLKGATSQIASFKKGKLPNGKVYGVIVLRVLPDRLDELVATLITELTLPKARRDQEPGRTQESARLQRGRHQALHRPGEPAAGRQNHGRPAERHHQGGQGGHQGRARGREGTRNLAHQDRGIRRRTAATMPIWFPCRR